MVKIKEHQLYIPLIFFHSIKITFNVNHTVDSDELEGEVQPEKQEFAEMRSRPQFEVDVIRGDTTLGFTCSFLQEPPSTNADEYSMS